jgi:hypothetical protein
LQCACGGQHALQRGARVGELQAVPMIGTRGGSIVIRIVE